jgi:hypothetical protein
MRDADSPYPKVRGAEGAGLQTASAERDKRRLWTSRGDKRQARLHKSACMLLPGPVTDGTASVALR